MCSGTRAHKLNPDAPRHELGIHGHEIRCQVHERWPDVHFADELNQGALTTKFKNREILSTLILVQRGNKSDQLTNGELTFRRTHPYIVWSESGPSTRVRRVPVSTPSQLTVVTLGGGRLHPWLIPELRLTTRSPSNRGTMDLAWHPRHGTRLRRRSTSAMALRLCRICINPLPTRAHMATRTASRPGHPGRRTFNGNQFDAHHRQKSNPDALCAGLIA
jgi:hypothetical protein